MTKSLHSDRYQALLSALIRARHDAGITQFELAQKLGKPQSYVSKVERGERRLDVLEFADVAANLGLSREDMVALLAR